jgi:phosphoserine phosphatase RsbU/P
LKVLIVEDDELSAMVLSEILSELGFESSVEADGDAGLARWRQERFPIVILDWMMPGLAGTDVCRRIREDEAEAYTYIILLTGRTEYEDKIEALEAGADDFLTKPVDLPELRARLGSATRILSAEQAVLKANAALTEARRHEAELGAQIQAKLLVGNPPAKTPGLEVMGMNISSGEVDGDFLDFFQYEETLDVVAGDVMGKGVPAALVGAGVKTSLQKSLIYLLRSEESLPEPARVMEQLHELAAAELIVLGTFVTLCYARFDPLAGTVSYVNSGHPKMIRWSALRDECEFLDTTSVPLGFLAQTSYTQQTVGLDVGDLILLYSDGVTDLPAKGGRLGAEGLLQWLSIRAHHPVEALGQELVHLKQALAGDTPGDDFTVVAVRRMSSRSADSLCFWSARAELADAREFVRESAARLQFSEEETSQIVLATQETLSNAVRHARPAQQGLPLDIHREESADALTLTLSYPGCPFSMEDAPPASEDGLREGGFGLGIIRSCVDEVEYSSVDGLNRVRLLKRRKG